MPKSAQKIRGGKPPATPRRRQPAPVLVPATSQTAEFAALYPKGTDLGNVAFSAILDFAEAKIRAIHAASTGKAKYRASDDLTTIARLRPFWSSYRCRDVDKDLQKDWVTALTSTRMKRGKRDEKGNLPCYSAGTAAGNMIVLRRLAYDFRDAFTLRGTVALPVPSAKPSFPKVYSRDDIAKMLWVIRGRVWDRTWNEGKGRWLLDVEGKRVAKRFYRFEPGWRRCWNGVAWEEHPVDETFEPRGELLNRHNWIARMILTGVYSGSTRTLVGDLPWDGTPGGDTSYVDLDTPIDGRVGHLFRLGRHAAPGAMANVPVVLTRRLFAHMQRWREIDRRHGYSYLLHRNPNDFRCHGSPDLPLIPVLPDVAELFREGGLDPLDWDAIVNTTAAWAIRTGRKVKGQPLFKPNPAIMRSAAFLIGITCKRFEQKYKSIWLAFNRKQKVALLSLPESVK